MAWGDTEYYDGHSAPQRSAAAGAVPAFLRSTDDWLALGPPLSPVVLADYGCAGGANALEPMSEVIGRVRAPGYGGTVVVVHTDLASNDFSTLFRTLAENPQSYGGDPAVFSVAVGKSFYRPLLPAGSVSLGWCAHAAHWLSHAPEGPGPPGHLAVAMAAPEVRAPWVAVAAADWADFLGARATELRPGGRVLVEMAALDGTGHFGAEPLYRVADRALADLVERGLLDGDRAARMVLPVVCRSEAEIRAPFARGDLARSLQLDSLEFRSQPDPYLDPLRRSGDAAAFARDWTATLRAFTEDQLFGPGETGMASEYYRTVAGLIEADPAAATNAWHVADIVLSRR